jgi:hypothetical protein
MDYFHAKICKQSEQGTLEIGGMVFRQLVYKEVCYKVLIYPQFSSTTSTAIFCICNSTTIDYRK